MKRPENMKHEFNVRACLKTSQTLHFVFEHESREWNLEREWSEWNLEREWSERN